MKKAFISYRRQDSPGHVRAVHDRLRQHFHPDQVFMDVEDIPLGTDFVTVLDKNLRDCVAMIVMIGPDWLNMRGANGKRRLDNENDFVRLEISQALRRNITVIPILVDGAMMPTEAELPEVLKPLARRQALELDNKHYDYGVNTLIQELKKPLGIPPHNPAADKTPTPHPHTPTPKPGNRLPLWAGIAGLFLCGAIGWLLFSGTSSNNNGHNTNNPVSHSDKKQTDPTAINEATTPTASAGFNCSQASSDVEDVICNSDKTRKADHELNRIYQQIALRIPPGAQERLRKRQLNWVKQRNTHIRQNCLLQSNSGLITQCVANYYQQRISTLSRLPGTLLSRVKIIDPPTNIRREPNGEIICQVSSRQMIEVFTDAVRERDGDNWYPTRVCGNTRWGMVHESQITSVN